MKFYIYILLAGEVVISLIKMYEANYPEILKCCYIINAPKVFAFAFSIVKRFLDDYTIGKIQIHKADQKRWLPAILETCDASQIPAYYGGSQTDDDGNPKCVKKVNYSYISSQSKNQSVLWDKRSVSACPIKSLKRFPKVKYF